MTCNPKQQQQQKLKKDGNFLQMQNIEKIYPVNITVRINALEIEHLKCCFVTDSG